MGTDSSLPPPSSLSLFGVVASMLNPVTRIPKLHVKDLRFSFFLSCQAVGSQFPNQGLNLYPYGGSTRVLTTRPPGNSLS